MTAQADPRWSRLLWIALAANLAKFAMMVGASFASTSAAMRAGPLDLTGDAANFAISLAVLGVAMLGTRDGKMIVRHALPDRLPAVGLPPRPRTAASA